MTNRKIEQKTKEVVTLIQSLPGKGKITLTRQECPEQYTFINLPADDAVAARKLRTVIATALASISAGSTIRMRQDSGKDFLYGIGFSNGNWEGSTSGEVEHAMTTCPGCGESAGNLLDHEVCCQFGA